MADAPRSSLARTLGFLALVFAVAFGGVYAGMKFREWRSPQHATGPSQPPEPLIAAGDEFPDVALVAESGEPAGSRELLTRTGGVVLFVEPGCPACGEAVAVWQSMLDAGRLDGLPVIGVSGSSPGALAQYRADKGLTFPVYSDPERVFLRDYEVTAVPFTVIVDATGAVRRAGYEPPTDLDPDEVLRLARGDGAKTG